MSGHGLSNYDVVRCVRDAYAPSCRITSGVEYRVVSHSAHTVSVEPEDAHSLYEFPRLRFEHWPADCFVLVKKWLPGHYEQIEKEKK